MLAVAVLLLTDFLQDMTTNPQYQKSSQLATTRLSTHSGYTRTDHRTPEGEERYLSINRTDQADVTTNWGATYLEGHDDSERAQNIYEVEDAKEQARRQRKESLYEVENSGKKQPMRRKESLYEVEDDAKKPPMRRKESLYEIENEFEDSNPRYVHRVSATDRMQSATNYAYQPFSHDEIEESGLSAVGLLAGSQTQDKGQYEPVQQQHTLSAVRLLSVSQQSERAGYEGVRRNDVNDSTRAGYLDVTEGSGEVSEGGYGQVRSTPSKHKSLSRKY